MNIKRVSRCHADAALQALRARPALLADLLSLELLAEDEAVRTAKYYRVAQEVIGCVEASIGPVVPPSMSLAAGGDCECYDFCREHKWCKHLAGVWCRLIKQCESDAFLYLTLRGIDVLQLSSSEASDAAVAKRQKVGDTANAPILLD